MGYREAGKQEDKQQDSNPDGRSDTRDVRLFVFGETMWDSNHSLHF